MRALGFLVMLRLSGSVIRAGRCMLVVMLLVLTIMTMVMMMWLWRWLGALLWLCLLRWLLWLLLLLHGRLHLFDSQHLTLCSWVSKGVLSGEGDLEIRVHFPQSCRRFRLLLR